MRKKLRSSKGMTLTELLVALAVVSLIGMALTVGINNAVKVYRDATQLYESETLCGTILTCLEDEFRFGRNVQKETGTVEGNPVEKVTFDSRSFGNGVSVTVEDDGKVMIGGQELLGKTAYTSRLMVLKDKCEITYDESKDEVKITIAVGPSPDKVYVEHTVRVTPLGD